MFEAIDSYIYMRVSFQTFKMDETSLLCLKYAKSKFFKKYYKKKILEALLTNPNSCLDQNAINYFIHSTLASLKNATLFLDVDNKEVKMIEKYLGREIVYANDLTTQDLSEEIKHQKARFMFVNKDDVARYKTLIDCFDDYSLIYLEDLVEEFHQELNEETIFDKIKLMLLQDNENEIYFIKFNVYSNIAAKYVYDLNKIAINI